MHTSQLWSGHCSLQKPGSGATGGKLGGCWVPRPSQTHSVLAAAIPKLSSPQARASTGAVLCLLLAACPLPSWIPMEQKNKATCAAKIFPEGENRRGLSYQRELNRWHGANFTQDRSRQGNFSLCMCLCPQAWNNNHGLLHAVFNFMPLPKALGARAVTFLLQPENNICVINTAPLLLRLQSA